MVDVEIEKATNYTSSSQVAAIITAEADADKQAFGSWSRATGIQVTAPTTINNEPNSAINN